ncbi:MAG: hypothetical protein GDA68_19415 [Nitrospira sp. CR2.1]|nr:hypothetical protein [Nitrospira sp. CR2.1]MBA5873314.1 hypothetical protein [Nitrospira sp. CR1.2]
MGRISWLTSVMILAALTVHAEEGPHRFSVDLPTGWQQASHVRLVLEGMTVAGGLPFKLQAAAIIEGAEPVILGSAGIVGDRSVGSAPRRLPTLLIDVTRPLGSLADRLGTQTAMTIRLDPVDGRNAPLKELDWSVQSVRLERGGRN